MVLTAWPALHARDPRSPCRRVQIGFFGILLVEAITNKALLKMLGFTVGQGLPFEF